MSDPFTRDYEPIPPMSAVVKIDLEARIGRHGMYYLEDQSEEYKRFDKWPSVINVNGYAYRLQSQRISRRNITEPHIEILEIGSQAVMVQTMKPKRVKFSVATYNMIQKRRLRVFAHKSCECVCCGRVGTRLIQHAIGNEKHWDLFTDDLVLMTIDHITPKSLGGRGTLENLQCMCSPCNFVKWDRTISIEELRIEILGQRSQTVL